MIASTFKCLVASGLLCHAHAQDVKSGHPIIAADGNTIDQQYQPSVQQGQQGAWDVNTAAVPLPAPILASDLLQSGQIPTYQPYYMSNTQGYYVPIYVDDDGVDDLLELGLNVVADPVEAPPAMTWNYGV